MILNILHILFHMRTKFVLNRLFNKNITSYDIKPGHQMFRYDYFHNQTINR
jgi:hypothetical protein